MQKVIGYTRELDQQAMRKEMKMELVIDDVEKELKIQKEIDRNYINSAKAKMAILLNKIT